MPRAAETVRLKRQDTKGNQQENLSTRVRKVVVRKNKVEIKLYLGKEDALRLAKAIDRKWGKG
jgi:hypothetical protein